MAALLFAPLNEATFLAAIACSGPLTSVALLPSSPSLVSEFFGLNNLAKNYGVYLSGLRDRQYLRLG